MPSSGQFCFSAWYPHGNLHDSKHLVLLPISFWVSRLHSVAGQHLALQNPAGDHYQPVHQGRTKLMFSSSDTHWHEDWADLAQDLASPIVADKGPGMCLCWCDLCLAIHKLIWEMASKHEIHKIKDTGFWAVHCSHQGWLRCNCWPYLCRSHLPLVGI